jgi:hypothetical protein
MMKAFALILHVLNAEQEVSTFVIDYNLSNEDCLELKSLWEENLDQYSVVTCE